MHQYWLTEVVPREIEAALPAAGALTIAALVAIASSGRLLVHQSPLLEQMRPLGFVVDLPQTPPPFRFVGVVVIVADSLFRVYIPTIQTLTTSIVLVFLLRRQR